MAREGQRGLEPPSSQLAAELQVQASLSQRLLERLALAELKLAGAQLASEEVVPPPRQPQVLEQPSGLQPAVA